MKQIIISALLLCTSIITQAQFKSKTSVKLELGYSNNIYDKIDPAKGLKIVHRGARYLGLNFQKDIGSNAFIQIGAANRSYDLQWGIKPESGFTDEQLMKTWLLQIGAGTRINISKNKIHLVPSIGYNHGFNSIYKWGTSKGNGSGYDFRAGADTVRYSTTLQRHAKNFSLLQTSIAVEFALNKRCAFSISGNYFRGFKVLASQEIDYKKNNAATNTGTINSKGDFYSGNLGFRFLLGKNGR